MCAGFASNMLWLDMEFTDLHKPQNGKILEIAARITTNSMRFIANATCHVIIGHESLTADDLNHFCREHFSSPRPADGNVSLVQLCNRSQITIQEAEAQLVDLVDVHRGNQQIQLCGATVRKDLQYIELYMPALYQRIHYQLRDATSQLSDALREFPAIRSFLPTRSRSHCAMDDIDETLRLSRWLSAITKRDFLQLPTGQILMRDGPTIEEVMTLDSVPSKRGAAMLSLHKTPQDSTGLHPFSASRCRAAPPIIFPMQQHSPSASSSSSAASGGGGRASDDSAGTSLAAAAACTDIGADHQTDICRSPPDSSATTTTAEKTAQRTAGDGGGGNSTPAHHIQTPPTRAVLFQSVGAGSFYPVAAVGGGVRGTLKRHPPRFAHASMISSSASASPFAIPVTPPMAMFHQQASTPSRLRR